jgi:metal-sulfur cluster biosynthetic enzyme
MNEETSQTEAPAAVSEQEVWDQLRNCYDPEIPLNIVDLGLIYDVIVNGSTVDVKMTLTAPGCHMGGQIAADAQEKILSLEQVEEANVELVWDPPWHQSMISAEGRKKLGLE